MPGIFDTPVSRRNFLATSAALTGSLLLPRTGAFADDKSAGPARIALLSDTHIPATVENNGYRGFVPADNLQEVVKQVLDSPAHAAILNGDAARLEGFRDDYVTLKKLLQPLAEKLPIHIGLGNHDDRGNFFKEFSQQPDSKELVQGKHVSLFSLGGTRFVVLDSLLYVNKVAGLLGKSQRDWLEKFLGDDDQSPVVFFVHHTLGDNDGDLLDVDRLFKLLAPHKKVKAIFVGHAHIYQFDKREHIHLINLPAIGYNFSDAQPIGWMSGAFTPQGAELTLHTIGGNKDKDGEVTKLDWA
ncbi:MAG: metallophosphoesterase [Planctomycetaceae bacterium]|nr:metallophosphoesterase [Planctomycetaceae bacterium]